MESPSLANIDPASDWTRFATTAFSARIGRSDAPAVLPVFGIADHGLGLPLDVEEVIGSEILRRACAALRAAGGEPWVLPPLRFGPAPYPSQHFGLDPDTGLDWLREAADGIRRTGFSRLVIVTTSPWHREWIDACALDLHAETGLEVFKLHLGDLGLALHPAAPMTERARTQAVGSALLKMQPEPCAPGEARDAEFRPGCFLQPPPVDASARDAALDAETWLVATAARCARLLAEACGKPFAIANPPASDAGGVWRPFARRYLPALTAAGLKKALPNLKNAVAILPTAAIEQHGPHLPVSVDALLGEGLLAAALAKLPADAPVWVTPPITVGKSVEHRDFAGTLSVSSRTLRALLTAQIEHLQALGFGTVAIWNTHGGNSAVITCTIRELQSRTSLRIGRLESGFKPELDAQEAAFGFHAGHWETALMLALAPELVDMSAAVSDYPARIDDPGELRPERGAITRAWMTAELSPTGVMGDARAATKEQGQTWVEATATALAARLMALVER